MKPKYILLIAALLIGTFLYFWIDTARRRWGILHSLGGNVDVEILAVEDRVLNGKMVGHFLGSSDGTIRDSTTTFGVLVKRPGLQPFVEDFDMLISEAALLADANSFTMWSEVRKDVGNTTPGFHIYMWMYRNMGGRFIHKSWISRKTMLSLLDDEQKKNWKVFGRFL